MILGKNSLIFWENNADFSQIEKVYLLNLDFSASWECLGSIGNFFSQFGKKKIGTRNGTQFCIAKKPLVPAQCLVCFMTFRTFRRDARFCIYRI